VDRSRAGAGREPFAGAERSAPRNRRGVPHDDEGVGSHVAGRIGSHGSSAAYAPLRIDDRPTFSTTTSKTDRVRQASTGAAIGRPQTDFDERRGVDPRRSPLHAGRVHGPLRVVEADRRLGGQQFHVCDGVDLDRTHVAPIPRRARTRTLARLSRGAGGIRRQAGAPMMGDASSPPASPKR
jgi:hypothetical protein